MVDRTSISNYFISAKGYVQNFICYTTIPIRRNSSARGKSMLTRARDTTRALSFRNSVIAAISVRESRDKSVHQTHF